MPMIAEVDETEPAYPTVPAAVARVEEQWVKERTIPIAYARAKIRESMRTVEAFGTCVTLRAKPSLGAADVKPYEPRTELGRRLWSIRKRAIAAGEAPASWEDIERELAELRREPGDDWD